MGNVHTLDDWADVVLLLGSALFLYYRGTAMWKKSTFFDRLGVSTIAFDLAFAVAYLTAFLFTVLPALAEYTAIRWGIRVVVFSILIWAAVEVRRATGTRINKAIGGDDVSESA